MLSFFRKIRKSLFAAGSTGKYLLYAVGEIVLVVLGILIALQVNNWNEHRKERETEVKVLKEVVENLEANINRLESMIERCETDNEACDIIMSTIGRALPYTDSLSPYFYYALNPVDEGSFLSYVGYESLKNVGFEIIQDNQLKKEIINLFEGIYLDLRGKYDRIEKLSSPEVARFRRQYFLFHPDTVQQQIGLKPIHYDSTMKDTRFESVLAELKGIRGWVRSTLKQSLHDTERVLQLIKDELGEPNV